jgi:manganese transport system ATP-binding protein
VSRIASADAVAARDLELRRGGRVALRVDELALPVGQVTALVGPNGSGKSTLLHAIAGLLSPIAGELTVLGEPAARARSRVAYVLQSTEVAEHLPVTVGEVVAMARYPRLGLVRRPKAADRAAVAEALERLELSDLVKRHVGELSGGQRQRVFVAQGLAQAADLLLLDEPVSGLDLASAERIRESVAGERAAGRTVVVSTHDLGEAQTADHVVLLAGRVVAAGPPAAALTPATLADAYGPRLVRLPGGALLLDDGAHHDHEH